jgi:hypothetical protein
MLRRYSPMWLCVLSQIMQLERTRGDGGYDYYSVDKGSAFTSCF